MDFKEKNKQTKKTHIQNPSQSQDMATCTGIEYMRYRIKRHEGKVKKCDRVCIFTG